MELLSTLLLKLARGKKASTHEIEILKNDLIGDRIQVAIVRDVKTDGMSEFVQEQIDVMQQCWSGFSTWWMKYFKLRTDDAVPVEALWRIYIPFSQWIVQQKRKRCGQRGYVVGVYGSQGRG